MEQDKYLILQRFKSFGVLLEKGQVVNADLIRSPQLRVSEGKIVKAVSSPVVLSEAVNTDTTASEGTAGEVEIKKPTGLGSLFNFKATE